MRQALATPKQTQSSVKKESDSLKTANLMAKVVDI